MMIERKDRRFEVELAAEVDVQGEVLLAATRNLSRGGVCLDVERPLTEGEPLDLSLFLTLDGIEEADTDALSVRATVVWCSEREEEGFTAGLQFGALNPSDAAMVERFLARLG
ncbi:MAG: PilZ domain-containing protein [Deltaproteobacteria bacterium]|nr:PilZ domain-containing protein [Deltaproteobacteria bacterium]